MILAIIQARMASTRLPGKVMEQLGDKTVLGNVISRVLLCKNVDGVIVATSNEEEDKEIAMETSAYGVGCTRGELYDVLSRYYRTAKFYKADRIVRITADCPFIMPDLIDALIEKNQNSDYGSNIIRRTYPKGLDCEIFTYAELERAFNCAVGDEREHVTPYIIKHAMLLRSLVDKVDFSRKRLTIDYPFDLDDMRKFYPKIGHVYNYAELKKILPGLVGTEEWCIAQELGRV